MKTSDFDYHLPVELIAQKPAQPRDSSRLLVLNRQKDSVSHFVFNQLGNLLMHGDLLVLNRTRVIPARIFARRVLSGGRVELLLLRPISKGIWETLAGGKQVVPGLRLHIDGDLEAIIIKDLGGTRRLVQFSKPIEDQLSEIGHVPLPPYIRTPIDDPEQYQTVFSRDSGSVAAPTAGLHFTDDLIGRLKDKGIAFTEITLHIGLDTFAPVAALQPQNHEIHTEWCHVPLDAVEAVERARRSGGRVIAVGTTSVRALETAASEAGTKGLLREFKGDTNLFILPGYEFRIVDGLITNFHLPRSTLLMLVSAFAGRKRILSIYELAKVEGYRFYSFGDAMLIL